MISIEGLNFSYGKKLVLNGFSLKMETGKIHGLLGTNGAGKTTFFKILYHLLKPSAGSIQYNGGKLTKACISYLETQNFFYPKMTGKEYLDLFKEPRKTFEIDFWRNLFKLPMEELVENYSTGMKKKLALLAILKQDREIFMLDEPFNGIDLETSRVLQVLLQKLKEREKTILLTSHILETLENSCDFIHVIEGGNIRESVSRDNFEGLGSRLFSGFESQVRRDLDQYFE